MAFPLRMSLYAGKTTWKYHASHQLRISQHTARRKVTRFQPDRSLRIGKPASALKTASWDLVATAPFLMKITTEDLEFVYQRTWIIRIFLFSVILYFSKKITDLIICPNSMTYILYLESLSPTHHFSWLESPNALDSLSPASLESLCLISSTHHPDQNLNV
jgi:hypothetical protein